MGGRMAPRVFDRRGREGRVVRSVAALAPWLAHAESFPELCHRALLLRHGTADRFTDPAKTIELAERLAAEGADVELGDTPELVVSCCFRPDRGTTWSPSSW
jgi:hypothetical protein